MSILFMNIENSKFFILFNFIKILQAKETSPMKRNFLLKGVVLSTIVSSLITGCSSVDSAIEDIKQDIQTEVEKQIQIAINGKAVDGYLQNAVVCLDLNKDGYCQANSEPMTTTLEDGSFALAVSQEHRDNPNFDEALLLVFGGVDVDTGKDFRGKLFAPNDGGEILNVSPITTLVAKSLKRDIGEQKLTKEQIREKIEKAKAKVADILDIEVGDIGADPIAFQKEHNDDRLIRQSLKLQKSIEALMVVAGIDGAQQDEKIDKIYEILAQANDVRGIDKLFEEAVKQEEFKEMFKDQDHEQMLRVTDAISQNLDTSFDQIEVDDNQLERIAAITNESFDDIREGVKSDNPDFIKGIVFVEDDKRFDKKFDWINEHIEQDLRELGIRPTPELVEKIKEVYKDKFRPGTLFNLKAAERLKNSDDVVLQELYEKILEYRADIKREKEAQEAKYKDNDIDLTKILAGNIFYTVSESDECKRLSDGREECELYIEKISVNDDASEAESDDGVQKLIFEKNGFFVMDDDEKIFLTYKNDTDRYLELYEEDGFVVKLFKNMEDAEKFLEEGERRREDERKREEERHSYFDGDDRPKIDIGEPHFDSEEPYKGDEREPKFDDRDPHFDGGDRPETGEEYPPHSDVGEGDFMPRSAFVGYFLYLDNFIDEVAFSEDHFVLKLADGDIIEGSWETTRDSVWLHDNSSDRIITIFFNKHIESSIVDELEDGDRVGYDFEGNDGRIDGEAKVESIGR